MNFILADMIGGGFLEDWNMELLATIRKLYAKQKEMFGVQLPRLFLFCFMDAPDGVSTCHMLEIEDEAA